MSELSRVGLARREALAVMGGAALLGGTQAAAGAITPTGAQGKLPERVRVKDFGAIGDGIVNDTPAIQAAIDALTTGGSVYFPRGTYLIRSAIRTTDGVPVLLFGDGAGSIIKKGFSGDLVSLGKLSEIDSLYLNCVGDTYMGRGVIISTGAADATSWRKIRNCLIIDSKSEGVGFNAATTAAGHQSTLENCKIVPHDLATPAIKWIGAQANSNVTLSNIFTESNPIADFGDVDDVQCVGCQGGEPIYSAKTAKVVFSGGRIVTSSGTLIFNGTANVCVGNTINTKRITFSSGLNNFRFSGNAVGSGTVVTDNAPGVSTENWIDVSQKIGAPLWTATGAAPDLRNGQLGSAYSRVGQRCTFNMFFIPGNTTTFGTGYWKFSLPYISSRVAVGSCWMQDSAGENQYVGVAVCQASNTIFISAAASTTAKVGPTVPFAWARGDILIVDIEFPIV